MAEYRGSPDSMRGRELGIGDSWYNTHDRETYIWDGDTWVPNGQYRPPGLQASDELVIEFPEVFPSQDEVYNLLLNAVRECVGTNVMRPVHGQLRPILGDKAQVFDASIVYREIGMNGSLDLFQGAPAVQQVLGKILHDDEVMSAFVNDSQNCLVNEHSMMNTRVTHNNQDGGVVKVTHRMPVNPLVTRYLRLLRHGRRGTGLDWAISDDMITIVWNVPYRGTDMSGVTFIVERLYAALTIYYKLLTRFPSCQSYMNDLPGFRNS